LPAAASASRSWSPICGSPAAARHSRGTASRPAVPHAPVVGPLNLLLLGSDYRVEDPENGIQLVLDTAQGPLTLDIPDPSRVQIRNAGSVAFEFVCGPQEPRKVLVEYAPAASILRGLEFR